MSYRTTKSPDGSVTLHDVEVFAEFAHPKGFEFDREWIESAVAKLQAKEAEGYLPPIHVLHHEGMNEVEQAGFFRVTGTRMLTLDGREVLGVIADLTITNPSAADRIQARQLPYRSVEILDVNNPFLDTLALLDHQPPALKFPMLGMEGFGAQFAEFTFHRHRVAEQAAKGFEVLASGQGGSASRILFRASPMENNDDDKKPAQMAEGDEGEGGGVSVKDVCAAIKSGDISVADFEEIQKAMAERAAPEADDDDDDEPEQMMAGPDTPKEMQMSDPASQADPKMAARVFELEAKLAAREAQDQRRVDVAKAVTRLTGRAGIGADAEAKFSAYHEEHGPKAFAGFVDQLASTLPMEMFGDQEAAARFSSQSQGRSAEVMAYENPAEQDMAAQFAAQYDELCQMGARPSQDKARFIKINMRRHAAAN